MTGSPAAEHKITAELARLLVNEQFPQYADQPLEHLDSGFDNTMYRLGESLLVRLPRRAVAHELVQNEQRWLQALGPSLSLKSGIHVPVPVHVGVPMHGYPWAFSILPWFEGQAADLESPEASEAPRFGQFLRALHAIKQPAIDDAPLNPFRGVALAARAAAVEERMVRLQGRGLMPRGIDRVWREALDAPVASRRVWLHGDLHARNVLVRSGKLTAVIDWGDITSGDAATDLASVWMLFVDPQARSVALEIYNPSPELFARAKGWAVSFGVMLLDTGLVDNPRHAAMGKQILTHLRGAN